MVRSYRDKKTRLFAEGQRIPQFHAFRHQAERRLRVLEAATSLQNLASLSSNHLEALGGDRKGQHSIRIWRICSKWPNSADGPENVEIVDYH